MEKLFHLLNSIHPVSPALQEELMARLTIRELSRKDYLLKAGHICRSICFVEKGLLRCFYNKGDTEVCSWFMKEGDVVVSIESFSDRNQAMNLSRHWKPAV